MNKSRNSNERKRDSLIFDSCCSLTYLLTLCVNTIRRTKKNIYIFGSRHDLPEERRLHTVGCWSSTALGKSGGHVRHRPIHLERQRKSTNIFSTRGIIIPGTSRFFILALRHILNSLRSIKFFTQSFSVLLVFLNVHIDYWGPPLDTVQLDTICFSLAGLIPLARCPHTTLFSLIAGSFCFKFFREIRLTVVAFLYLLSFVLLCIFRHRGYTDDVKVTCNQISRLNLLLLVNPG